MTCPILRAPDHATSDAAPAFAPAAEARRRFGAHAIRILRKLGGDTGAVQAGDASGNISADALMYFDMSFRLPR